MGVAVEFTNSVGAPESLDLAFFDEVLENALYGQCVEIRKVLIESGSAVGDNYCSQIYRVRISFHQRNSDKLDDLSVIVKSMPITKNMEFLSDLQLFLKEKVFYMHMLPRMEILLDNVKLGGRLYFSAKQPINTLVLEDLCSTGYVMADREKGLDLDHCLIVMKKLGHFHGVSMVLNKKHPGCMKNFSSSLLCEKNLKVSDTFTTIFRNTFDGLIKLVSTWEGYGSITKKLQNYAINFKQNLIKTQLPDEGKLKVLNHGDMWVNNLLFKYNDNTNKQSSVNDVTFIDFQFSFFASPGFDLNYFFYTSMQLDVLKEKREELLRTYHTALCDTLKCYNFEYIPSFDEILIEFRRKESFGFFASFGIFPGVVLEKKKSSDNSLEKFMEKDFANKKLEIIFSSKRLIDTMKYILKRFDELGVLDEFMS